MDIIFIQGLKVKTTIGVFDWERRIKQNLLIDLEVETDCRKASENDDLKDALSYKDVANRVSELVAESEFKLVESVAERVASVILEEFPTAWCRVNVSKPRAVENSASVGVMVERGERTR